MPDCPVPARALSVCHHPCFEGGQHSADQRRAQRQPPLLPPPERILFLSGIGQWAIGACAVWSLRPDVLDGVFDRLSDCRSSRPFFGAANAERAPSLHHLAANAILLPTKPTPSNRPPTRIVHRFRPPPHTPPPTHFAARAPDRDSPSTPALRMTMCTRHAVPLCATMESGVLHSSEHSAALTSGCCCRNRR